MSFPYRTILKESITKIWENKKLLLLGLFITESGLMLNLNFNNTDVNAWRKLFSQQGFDSLATFLSGANSGLWLWLVFGCLIIIFGLISLISKAAMLNAVKKAEDEIPVILLDEIKFGVSQIKKFIIFELLVNIPNILLIVLMFLSFIFIQVPTLTLIMSILVFLYNIFLIMFRHYSYCQLIFEKVDPITAIQKGFSLFAKNIKVTVLINLIRFVLMIGFIFVTIIATVISSIPFVLLVFLTSMFGVWTVPFAFAIIGLVVAVGMVFAVKGIKLSYFFTFMTKTYWQLTK